AAKKLMEMGADPADNCRYGISPIYRAVMEKNSEALEMYLAAGADPNYTGECNITLLGTACADGSEDIAKILLDAGADPNYGPYAYIPALHYAAMNDKGFNYSLVKLLIENGADPSARIYDHGKEMLPFRYYFDRFSDAVLHGTITEAEREDFARISELLYEPYADRLVERVENIRGKKEDEYETVS
ncbi:MAG: ankyrin repeat domain-containing protein, partial [Huintestinicola sp.]